MAIDLQSPLDEFHERTAEIRRIVAAIEAAAKAPAALNSLQAGVDLAKINLSTENTVNSMSLVFLASSFEEFVREEIGQCADYMIARYPHAAPQKRAVVRSSYWEAALGQLKHKKTLLARKLTKSSPKTIDSTLLNELQAILDSATGFVSRDDPSFMLRSMFSSHSNNFRPHVVNEISARLDIQDIIAKIADTARIKKITNESKRDASVKKLRSDLDNFYTRRNRIVHSLSASGGFGASILIKDIELLEATAMSMKDVLTTETSTW